MHTMYTNTFLSSIGSCVILIIFFDIRYRVRFVLLSASIRNYGNVFKDVKFAYLLTQH